MIPLPLYTSYLPHFSLSLGLISNQWRWGHRHGGTKTKMAMGKVVIEEMQECGGLRVGGFGPASPSPNSIAMVIGPPSLDGHVKATLS